MGMGDGSLGGERFFRVRPEEFFEAAAGREGGRREGAPPALLPSGLLDVRSAFPSLALSSSRLPRLPSLLTLPHLVRRLLDIRGRTRRTPPSSHGKKASGIVFEIRFPR
jgi:hypothetical protein